jgi:hypothetical protein
LEKLGQLRWAGYATQVGKERNSNQNFRGKLLWKEAIVRKTQTYGGDTFIQVFRHNSEKYSLCIKNVYSEESVLFELL